MLGHAQDPEWVHGEAGRQDRRAERGNQAWDAHTYGAGYTGLLVEAVTPHGKFYVCNNCAADHYAEYCVKSEVGNA
jgi:hypothetical protein